MYKLLMSNFLRV